MKRLLITILPISILPILFLLNACTPQPQPEPEEPEIEEPQEQNKASFSVSPDSISLPGTNALLTITITSNTP